MHFEFDDLPDWDHLRLHLAYGQRNAVTQAQLAKATGISVRAVQEAMEAAKHAGIPIVTGSAGCWLSDSREELLSAYRRDRARAIQQLVNNRGRLKAIRALAGIEQQSLWDAA
jgi:biotin operon repressor